MIGIQVLHRWEIITQASILATFQKLSTAEVLAGITFRAAKLNLIKFWKKGKLIEVFLRILKKE